MIDELKTKTGTSSVGRIAQADYTFSFVIKHGRSQRENNVSLITRLDSTRYSPLPSRRLFRAVSLCRDITSRSFLPGTLLKWGLKRCLRESQKHYRLYLSNCTVLLFLLSSGASVIFVSLISVGKGRYLVLYKITFVRIKIRSQLFFVNIVRGKLHKTKLFLEIHLRFIFTFRDLYI